MSFSSYEDLDRKKRQICDDALSGCLEPNTDETILVDLFKRHPFLCWVSTQLQPTFLHISASNAREGLYTHFVGIQKCLGLSQRHGLNSSFPECLLCEAIRGGSTHIVKDMLERGLTFGPTSEDLNPLWVCVEERPDLLPLLLSYGLDTTRSYGQMTLAMHAGYYDIQPDILKLLDSSETPAELISDWQHLSLPDLTGEGMTKRKIMLISQTLGCSIPSFLIDFYSNKFPAKLYAASAPDNDARWEWLNEDFLLFHTVRSFLAYNLEDFSDTKSKRWSDEYFVIGTNGGGDLWCVPVDGPDRVYIYEHELELLKDSALDLAAFTETYLEEME